MINLMMIYLMFIIMDGLSWFFHGLLSGNIPFLDKSWHIQVDDKSERCKPPRKPPVRRLGDGFSYGSGYSHCKKAWFSWQNGWDLWMFIPLNWLMIQFQPWFHGCFYLFWYSSDLRFHWWQVWSRPVAGVSGLAHGMEDEMGHSKHFKYL